MKLGLIGFPNSGKKTLFKLLTGNTVINFDNKDSISGIAKIRDKRFDNLVEIYKPLKEVPAVIDFLLIKDIDTQSAQNIKPFLAIQNVDVLCHIVRVFSDDRIFHINGTVDPLRDIEFFNNELIINDLLFIEKRLERLEKERGKKNMEQDKDLFLKLQNHLEENKPLRTLELSEEEKNSLKGYSFLTLKSMLIVLNIDEKDLGNSTISDNFKDRFNDQDIEWVQVSAKLEQELSLIEEKEEQELFLKELGIDTPAIDKFTILAYKSLGLISFFTVGKDEVRAWMVAKDSKAPQAARAVHTDMERGFIRAEVMKYDDIVTFGDENKVFMVKGKDYIVEDGDILSILFNV